MPAALMRFFARTRRVAIVDGGTEKARPTCPAVKPSTVLSIRGVRTARLIAGCAHTSISSSRRSGIESTSMSSICASASRPASRGTARCARADFHWSRSRLRATVSSHASGLPGTPCDGHVRRARSNASASASSAAARSLVEAASRASSRP
jgi:hypothetical protein